MSVSTAVHKRARTRILITIGVTVTFVLTSLTAVLPNSARAGTVAQIDVAPVWSVHATGEPVLLTTADYQYVAYYDANLYLTIAQRPLASESWTYRTFSDVQSSWETLSHHAIAMQIDSAGRIHVTAAMHSQALKYYRMTNANDMSSFVKFTSMVGTSETQVTYPIFLKDAAGALYYTYRTGVSGNGSQLINKWNATTQTWSRVVSSWFDGTATNQSSYISGPTLGPDGQFHVAWVWRDTSDVATNHDVSYATSPDLVNWTTAGGSPISLPITPATAGVIVDPVATNGGLFNGFTKVGFDGSGGALVTYVKYDPAGKTQLYTARPNGSTWSIVQGTNWDYRWNLSGVGAVPLNITFEPPRVSSGQLVVDYMHVKYGSGRVVLNDATLQPTGVVAGNAIPRELPEILTTPETLSPPRPMTVALLPDIGTPPGGQKFVLRWEHGPINNDAAVATPWPSATMLRVVQLNSSVETYSSDNLARGKTVTSSSSYEASGWGRAKSVDGKIFPVSGAPGFSSSSSTTSNHAEWVTVDLGETRDITQVSLFPANAQGYGMPVSYTVKLSTDNAAWTTVATRNNVPLSPGQVTHGFAATSARYVKVDATSLRANPSDANQYRLQLAEIHVFEKPSLAQAAVVSASTSLESNDWALTNVVNGAKSPGSGGWTSNGQLTVNHQETLTVDLGSAKTVSRVALYPATSGNFFPLDFQLQVSVNGSSWTTVLTRASEPIPATRADFGFAATSARFVRLVATSLRQWSGDGNKYRVQLAEIEVR